MSPPGRGLVLVVGPSGAGKDSCIDWALDHAPPSLPLLRAHRYCTRESERAGRDIPCSESEFARREAIGCFALRWRAHGLAYGIGIEIDRWLDLGAAVLVSGSRAAVPACRARYPELTLVHIGAPAAVLAQRLAARGRESEGAIDARLQRAEAVAFHDPQAFDIVNDGPLSGAGTALLDVASASIGRRLGDLTGANRR